MKHQDYTEYISASNMWLRTDRGIKLQSFTFSVDDLAAIFVKQLVWNKTTCQLHTRFIKQHAMCYILDIQNMFGVLLVFKQVQDNFNRYQQFQDKLG